MYSHIFLFAALWIVVLLNSCNSEKENQLTGQRAIEVGQAIRISGEKAEAAAPYLTRNHQGNPVLCWTEKSMEEEEFMVKFSVFDPLVDRFGKPVTVMPSKGTRIHPEGMNKVAFKNDGTVVAVYAERHPTEDNPFAGSIFYTISMDQGKTWSGSAYLHSDTLPTYGRGFFDLVTLPDGEVGAVWLDGRFGDSVTGSALFFAQTENTMGFGADRQIGEAACECCRTDIFVDGKGDIHIAFRKILFPQEVMGQQVRDMVHIVSSDRGKTFSLPKRISADNWAIAGCPHTGPTLASTQQGLHATWFTGNGGPGVYYTYSVDNGNTFSSKQKVSEEARHPQLTSLETGELVLVWDEPLKSSNHHQAAMVAPQHQGSHAKAQSVSQILLQIRSSNGAYKNKPVGMPGADASYAVVIPQEKQKIIIAWTQGSLHGTGVYYQSVGLE